MMKEQGAQVSLEYLLIFSISLIIMIAFTLPLLQESMDNTFDVSDSIKTKSDLSKLALAIKQVYGEGQGSKQTVKLYIDKPIRVSVSNNHISSNLKLKNGDNKKIYLSFKSKLKASSFNLDKGENIFIVEWPVGNENMVIYHK